MLTRLGRREWPHLSESSRSPRRIGVAGDGEGYLRRVFLVAWRGSSEVEGVVLVEGELGVAIYSRPEAVPSDRITPVMITASR